MRIGICTGGGDCPGLNAAIRALVQSAACSKEHIEIVGIYDSINGIMDRPLRSKTLSLSDVSEILFRGGTILGTHNKGNPLNLDKNEKAKKIDSIRQGMKELKLDCLIMVGGEGSQGIASELCEHGLNIIGIPKTIDNDLPGSDQTIGFATCVDLVAHSVMRLRSTAESHDRIMILEVMGRDSGYIALHGGLAGGAHGILVPEIPFEFEALYKKVLSRSQRGRKFSVIVVSEGASEKGRNMTYKTESSGASTLGGIGQYVAQKLYEISQMETRVTVLGHLQRGGEPNANDRILATRFATHALELVKNKQFGKFVIIKGGKISNIGYSEIARFERQKLLADDEILHTAEAIGICLGR